MSGGFLLGNRLDDLGRVSFRLDARRRDEQQRAMRASVEMTQLDAALLKPHTAPCSGCSAHLKRPAKLPRQSLNESQP
jgi:hypothetical protein